VVGESDRDGSAADRADAKRAEMFRLAAESTRDMILIGRPGNPEWVSPSVTELLGHSPETFLAARTVSYVHPDDLDEEAPLRLPEAGGEEIGGRVRMLHADGTYRWMEARVRLLPDEDGTFTNRSISSWRNVDREVLAQTELQQSEERYRLLVENVSDGVALERDGMLVWASPNLHSMIGWDPEKWMGRGVVDFVERSDTVEIARTWSTDGERHTLRLRVLGADREVHWIEVLARPYIDAAGERDGTVCTFRLVDVEVDAEQELERRARYDQLTGLLNRKEIIDRLDAIGVDGRHPGNESAVLFCDLDDFKTVNDTHGHAVGDLVLKEVAGRVRHAIREGDLVARIGGDELLVVLHHLHGVEEAMVVAEEIRRATSKPVGGHTVPVVVTMSVGVTMVVHGDTADDVIARADQAMYRAKEAGRDGVQRQPLDPWRTDRSSDPDTSQGGRAGTDSR
jgi:diguanylate cyclase (GGDEF)-like protein/PAS domain S-box-containing protein